MDESAPKRKAGKKSAAPKEKGKNAKGKAPAKKRKVAVAAEGAEPVGGEVGVKDDCALFSTSPLSPSILQSCTPSVLGGMPFRGAQS